eukprot:1488620-Prorocentrum_lima.AAC.1
MVCFLRLSADDAYARAAPTAGGILISVSRQLLRVWLPRLPARSVAPHSRLPALAGDSAGWQQRICCLTLQPVLSTGC